MTRPGPPAVDIVYDVHGFDDDPALLLVAGLGNQLIFWDDEFIQGLLDRSFRVIVFDNRDVGLSTSFSGSVDDDAVLAGTLPPPYDLSDMAGDAVAVLDDLGIEPAHVLGISMGGLIAQVLALEHPDRVQTLTLLSSTTGDPSVGQPTPECLSALFSKPPEDPDEVVEADVDNRALWATPAYFDREWTRDYFRRVRTRSIVPGGMARQSAAVIATLAATDHQARLASLDVPTLVLHGTADPLIDRSGGEQLADLIPGAELVLLDDMAHDLPPHYWAPVIESVTQLAIRSLRA